MRIRWLCLAVLLCSVVALLASQAQEAGQLQVRVGFEHADGSRQIQNIPLETYVARVLAGEAAPQTPPAALEALAIAIRTFAIVNRNRHNANGFDLCDTTHCQVLRAASAVTERTANATAGLVLERNGVPVPVYYSASCGGHTEVPSAVWPGSEDPPYLPAQPDDACEGAPMWTANISAADLTRSFKAAGFRGERLRDMDVAARDASGRVSKLRLDGFSPDQISGQDLRVALGRTVGWLLVKSAAFEVERRRDGGRDVYHFEGHGYGHGVGMCVIGSVNLAARGQTAEQILARYYPGLDIVPFGGPADALSPVPTTPRVVTLFPGSPGSPGSAGPAASPRTAPRPAMAAPAGVEVSLTDLNDNNERSVIESLAARIRDEVARELGVAAPARLFLRVHPSTQIYERATGQPWFTFGAFAGGEVHLMPSAALRERGILERTIRRELVHAVVDEPLADRPAWVREGAALYFSGGRTQTSDGESSFRPRSRLACPDDVELLQPVSAGALSNAYARALACFASQARDGKTWREVK